MEDERETSLRRQTSTGVRLATANAFELASVTRYEVKKTIEAGVCVGLRQQLESRANCGCTSKALQPQLILGPVMLHVLTIRVKPSGLLSRRQGSLPLQRMKHRPVSCLDQLQANGTRVPTLSLALDSSRFVPSSFPIEYRSEEHCHPKQKC